MTVSLSSSSIALNPSWSPQEAGATPATPESAAGSASAGSMVDVAIKLLSSVGASDASTLGRLMILGPDNTGSPRQGAARNEADKGVPSWMPEIASKIAPINVE